MSDRDSIPVEAELMARIAGDDIDEATAIEVLRNPFCTVEMADRISRSARLTSTHRVCELLCSIRGLPAARVHDLIATLPWVSLLRLTQAHAVPPMVRRLAENKLILRMAKLTLGEKISLARRSHRALFKHIVATGVAEVLVALLENPRTTENDVVVLLGTTAPPPVVISAVNRSTRWSRRRRVRLAVARCASTPLPVALSALAELGSGELRKLVADPKLSTQVRQGARRLLDRRLGGSATNG